MAQDSPAAAAAQAAAEPAAADGSKSTLPPWTRSANHWNTIVDALRQLRRGGAVVVMDDESRENEGDLVMAAEFASLETMAFFCRYSSGLLCAPLTAARAKALDLPPMVADNTDRNETAFTVSVDYTPGTTTGASAGDRAITAKALTDDASRGADFSRPGHLFPLVARSGGVLERGGHTEASVDLCLLAALKPVAVIGELMRQDGTMMRLAECRAFAAQFDLPIINVEQLTAFRRAIPALQGPLAEATVPAIDDLAKIADGGAVTRPFALPKDSAVQLTAECLLPVDLVGGRGIPEEALFRLMVFRSLSDDVEHVALVKGNVKGASAVLTRVHSVCITGDVLGSMRCDCGPQLHEALATLAQEENGILIYVRDHEGRGIGITQKVRAYALQQQHSLDTYEANQALGLPHDCRDYASVNAILESLGVASVELMTNNPLKVDAIDMHVTGVRALKPSSLHSRHADYLRAKHQREVDVLESLMQNGLAPSGPKAHLAEALSAIVSCNASASTSSAASDTDVHSGADLDVGDALDLADGAVVPSSTTAAAPAESKAGRAARAQAALSSSVTSDVDGMARVDEAIMRRALRLALRGRMSAPPNPWVGCVLIRNATVIGEGFHHRAGEPHAEVMALTDAAQKYCVAHGETYSEARRAELVALAAAGATAYVTLEPCHHTGRTGPCDEALLAAGVARVVVAVVDPDERVSAQGLAKLRDRGVEVVTGVLQHEVAQAMRPYLEQRRTGRAYCVLKTALSIDGKVACADGTSQWITGAAARQDAHLLRARSQAVLVGAGTAVTDRPRLTPRVAADDVPAADVELRAQLSEPRAQPLLRVVLDGRGRVTEGPLLDTTVNPTLIFTSAEHCPVGTRNLWTKAGVRVVEAPATLVGDAGDATPQRLQLDLAFVLRHLAQKEGVLQVMIEGGAAVHAALLNAGLVDELHVYTGPKLLGGSALAWPSAPVASTIGEAMPWTLSSTRRVGDGDLCSIYRKAASDDAR